MITSHQARIELLCDKSNLAVLVSVLLACWKGTGEILTPASPDSLPPIGELIAGEPFWWDRTGTAGEGIAHLRVWPTAVTTTRSRRCLCR
jgi:hypothetical protein